MENGKPKGGRPPKPISEKRSEEIKFHVTPEIKARLQDEAKAAGVDLATYCREKVLTGRPPRRIPSEVLAAIAELARQGNNLNQLAKIANSEKSMTRITERLAGLLDFYEGLAAEIRGYFISDHKRSANQRAAPTESGDSEESVKLPDATEQDQ